MILRTILILGIGAAQPAGLSVGLPALAASPLQQAREAAAVLGANDVLAREFAAWRADLLTRREGPETLTELQALVARVEALVQQDPEGEQSVALLADLYRVEFRECERRLGLGALRELFLERLTAAHPGEGADDAARALGAASAVVLSPGRIDSLVGTAFRAAAAAGGDDDSLDSRRRHGPQAQMLATTVADAVAAGDEAFVKQLGSAAVPPLKALAGRLTGERAKGTSLDPLRLLAKVDPAAALDVAVGHCRTGDLLLKLRVVQAFEGAGPFLSEGLWSPTVGGQSELLNPAWAEIVESFYADPAVPVELADEYLVTFVQRGYAPGGVAALIPDFFIRGQGAAGKVVHPVAVAAAMELLDRPEGKSQAAGIRVLMGAPSVEPLFQLVGSRDPAIRAALAPVFGARTVAGEVVAPGIDADYRAALRVFLTVDDVEVPDFKPFDPVGAALYASSNLAHTNGTAAVDGALVALLADEQSDLSPAAFRALIGHLFTLTGEARREGIEALGAALVSIVDTEDDARVQEWQYMVQSLLRASLDLDEGSALVGVFERASTLAGWKALIETQVRPSGSVRYSSVLKELEPTEQLRIVRALWGAGYESFHHLDDDELSLGREHWLLLVADETLPKEARAWAIEALAHVRDEVVPVGAAEVLAGAVADIGHCPIPARDMQSMGVDTEVYFRALLDDPTAPDSAVLGTWIPINDDGLADRMLQRFPAATWAEHHDQPGLAGLISALVRRRDVGLNDLLAHANIQRTAVQSYLMRAIDATRYEGHLELGGAILMNDVVERDIAIEFVTSFSTDGAAKCLIEAMESARSEGFRAALFSALQRMTEVRNAADRWGRTGDAGARRDVAVTRLVNAIEDPASSSVKVVESILALGLLDARAELPRLIELLDSGDEARRAAARKAIDQMGQ